MTIAAVTGKLKRRIKCLIFDLDDTLYRIADIPRSVQAGITGYMAKYLGFPQETVVEQGTQLYQQYGTTLAGLVATGYKIDFDHWHQHVHKQAVAYHELIKPDPALRELLCSMDVPKYVFTNADKEHAKVCLELLGLSDCFQGVYHFESLMDAAKRAGLLDPAHPSIVCKPNPKAYELVLQDIGVDPSEVVFFDDSVRNVASAHALGILTVLVGSSTVASGSDLALPDLHHLPSVLPELLDQPGMVKEAPMGQQREFVVTVASS
uniref:Pyrimidine 5-nucleotidase n=1 Tax=Chlamydomonas chlamydogama TaxID=225041 RepID=A0A7S2QUN3_9CHLO|mmetsp:Transcript_426/g.866  ORF Transcript_426/g.866 Transcript_426/m.866 type:complete len:264 (+) Transcript_426:255-1046(+)|eukprot:CAMPEP_0202909060 /NCGR_PEP_ID=MMETSP1392-20130828/48144_1 /ASSEMBLY_ACC=CAM_ASM_000868 /TAXON_ID=225041 /ORGANISM="Chlamydomonas chlamydogama, Strain SAG 11-48b" /LENGTH=263 /DNA_ID=CAMNT_0049598667 /DNA_START=174 /DNA_END=965 /DNA_ORIENTATION=-